MMPPAYSTLNWNFGVGGGTPGWHKPRKGLQALLWTFRWLEIGLLDRFPVVIRLGVPVSFVVRATHLHDNVQGELVDGMKQASVS